jgi:hypothetical protein
MPLGKMRGQAMENRYAFAPMSLLIIATSSLYRWQVTIVSAPYHSVVKLCFFRKHIRIAASNL